MEEPLARPSEVIKRLRGTAEEQLAALGTIDKAPRQKVAKFAPKAGHKRPPKPKPRPNRRVLDEAEAALTRAQERHREAVEEIAEREVEIAREREALKKTHGAEVARLEAKRSKAEAAYEAALRTWRDD